MKKVAFKLLVIIAFFCVVRYLTPDFIVDAVKDVFKEKEEVTSVLLENEIKDIKELTVLKHTYKNPGSKFENTKWLSTKRFTVSYTGVIRMGFDLDKVKTEVDNEKRHIIIHFPQPYILSHEIDDDTLEVLDYSNGWWNTLSLKEIFEIVHRNKNKYAGEHFKDFSAEAKDAFKNKVSEHLSRLIGANITESRTVEKAIMLKDADSYTIEFVEDLIF